MRKLVFVLALVPVLGACKNFGWTGQGGNLTREQKERGIQDVAALSSANEKQAFYRGMRRRMDGRSNAFARDLENIQRFMDRHIWNYSWSDPYVNHPTDTTYLEHLGRFGASEFGSLPLVDEVTRR